MLSKFVNQNKSEIDKKENAKAVTQRKLCITAFKKTLSLSNTVFFRTRPVLKLTVTIIIVNDDFNDVSNFVIKSATDLCEVSN